MAKLKPQEQILYGSPQGNFTGFANKPVLANRAPNSQDTGFPLGQAWIDKVGLDSYVLVNVAAGVATWIESTIPSNPTFNTVTANEFITADLASGLTITQNEINADGTDTNINVEINPKGTGQLVVSKNASFVNNAVTTQDASITIHSGNQGEQRLFFRDETGNLGNFRFGGSASSFPNEFAFFIGSSEAGANTVFNASSTEFVFGNTTSAKSFAVDSVASADSFRVDGTTGEITAPIKITSAILATSDPDSGLEMAINNINAVGNDPDINIILNPKGTGDIIANVGGYEGNEFRTNTFATNLTISSSTLAAGGSNANVDITLTPKGTGNVVTSRNFVMNTVGGGLRIAEQIGQPARMGIAVLVAGSATIANTSVTANTRIFLTSNVPGGTPGFVRISAITPGVSFTITSSSGTDTSTVSWLLIEPA